MPAPKPKKPAAPKPPAKPKAPAKPKSPAKPAKPAVASGPVVLSPKLEALRAEMRGLLESGRATAWDFGVLYNRVVDEKLAEASGYRRSADFFAEHFSDMRAAMLELDGRLARWCSREQVVRFGPTKLDQLITWLTRQKKSALPTRPEALLLEIPAYGSKAARTCTFAQATTTDLDALLDGAAPKVKEPKLPAELVTFLAQLNEAMSIGLGENAPKATGRPRGRYGVFDITDIPGEMWGQLKMALDQLD